MNTPHIYVSYTHAHSVHKSMNSSSQDGFFHKAHVMMMMNINKHTVHKHMRRTNTFFLANTSHCDAEPLETFKW